ncbi:MAG: hypothetical protein II126_04300 [Erysipelotrichaceae bacterium]|nr:hypothetical protein [Erysipelotrichaceae bacterium]
MNHIAVIGPSYQQDVTYLKNQLSSETENSGTFSSTIGGGCYLIALALANLKCEVDLITRFGNDDAATRMWSNLENKSVTVISHDIPFETARKLSIVEDFTRYDIDNLPLEIHPGPEDNLPVFILNRADYGLLNVINNELAALAITRFPNVRWVAYDYIPDDQLLPGVTGIILTPETASRLSFADKPDEAVISLLEKGVQWIIVLDEGKGAMLYNSVRSVYHKSDYQAKNNFYIGCNELFIADLLCLLSRDFPLEICIQMALRFAGHKLEIPDTTFPDQFQ